MVDEIICSYFQFIEHRMHAQKQVDISATCVRLHQGAAKFST